ncbi:hypothetical protein MRX96_050425 [Rhipicephalus microplus]
MRPLKAAPIPTFPFPPTQRQSQGFLPGFIRRMEGVQGLRTPDAKQRRPLKAGTSLGRAAGRNGCGRERRGVLLERPGSTRLKLGPAALKLAARHRHAGSSTAHLAARSRIFSDRASSEQALMTRKRAEMWPLLTPLER